ncbi:MAG: lipocalin family protein [Saprospiraceae bacterium]|jgi:hypothetical protein
MKNTILSITALLLIGFVFGACKKDKTYDERLTATWESNNVKINSADYTSFFQMTLKLESNKDFNIELTVINPFTGATEVTNSTGEWEANESNAELTLTYDGSNDIERYDIITLTDNNLELETILDGDRLEIQLSK